MRVPAHRLLAAGVCLCLLAGPPAAGARDLTPAQLRRLALRAANDPAALGRIRRADGVAGRPVDFRALLSGAEGHRLTARLQTLAESLASGDPGTNSSRARRSARRILAGRAFRPALYPRPLAGALRRLGLWLTPFWKRLTGMLDVVARWIPGGGATVWAALAGVVVAGAVLLAGRLARRPSPGSARGRTAVKGADEPDPARLERLADEAEAAGDATGAVRLRFRAGLLRLGQVGVITLAPSVTAGEVRRRLGSDAFGPLATAFEEIVYGGRPATPDDAAAARRGWDQVRREVNA